MRAAGRPRRGARHAACPGCSRWPRVAPRARARAVDQPKVPPPRARAVPWSWASPTRSCWKRRPGSGAPASRWRIRAAPHARRAPLSSAAGFPAGSSRRATPRAWRRRISAVPAARSTLIFLDQPGAQADDARRRAAPGARALAPHGRAVAVRALRGARAHARQRVVEHPLARLRRAAERGGAAVRDDSARVEADGEHVLAARARGLRSTRTRAAAGRA